MTTPTNCSSCGHELGIGRFCTNCGKPVPGRHPEAAPGPSAPRTVQPVTVVAPPQRPPSEPPPAGQLPPAARYPLFAEPPPSGPPHVAPPPAPGHLPRRGGPRWVPWVIGVVALALLAAVAWVVVASNGEDDGRASDDPSQQQSTDGGSGATDSAGQPDSEGTGGPVEAPDADDVDDLTGDVEAGVPAVAAPSRDRNNQPVDFEPENLFDQQPRTSWRMPGDGSGETLTFDLGEEAVVTEVGLINGYAKIDGPDNWYQGNRRIRAVQWEFDDGTRITQDLLDRRTMQSLRIDPVATSTITLHLVTVTAPGKGPNGRDFTAISEIRLLGVPA